MLRTPKLAPHRRTPARRLAPALLVAFGASAWAGTIRHDVADALYTDLAAEPQFVSAGKLTTSSTRGSGVLIGPRHALTAAHLVDEGVVASDVRFEVEGQILIASEIIIHPDWTGDITLGADLAILCLATAPSGVTPATPLESLVDLGAVGTFVGFGDTGNGLIGTVAGSQGTKRAGENVIDETGDFFGIDSRILFSDFDHPTSSATNVIGSAAARPLEYQSAPGDSGSGLFIETLGQWRLAGITSFNSDLDLDDCATCYGEVTGFGRLNQFSGWIEDVLCPSDVNNDRMVGIDDFLAVLAGWGPCGATCPADGNGDGIVGIDDFLAVLAAWGACP